MLCVETGFATVSQSCRESFSVVQVSTETATAARSSQQPIDSCRHGEHHYSDTSYCLSKYPACHLSDSSLSVEQRGNNTKLYSQFAAYITRSVPRRLLMCLSKPADSDSRAHDPTQQVYANRETLRTDPEGK